MATINIAARGATRTIPASVSGASRKRSGTRNVDDLSTKGITIAEQFPTPLERNLDWKCAGHPTPEIFQPTSEAELAEARSVCGTCPMATVCHALGVDRDEWGVWGGVLLENGKPLETPRAPGRPKKIPTPEIAAA